MCDQTTNTTAQIQSGEIKAYAVTTPERIEALPDLPTTAEAGCPDVEVGVWHGLYVAGRARPTRSSRSSTTALAGRRCRTRTSSTAWPNSAPPRRRPRTSTPEAHTAKLAGADRPLEADHRGRRGHRRMSTDHTRRRRRRAPPAPFRPDLLRGRRSSSCSASRSPSAARVRRRHGAADGARATSRWSSAASSSCSGSLIVAQGVPRRRPADPRRRAGADPVARGGACSSAALMFFGLTVRGLGLGAGAVRDGLPQPPWPPRHQPAQGALIAAGLTALCLVVFVGLLQLRLPLFGDWLRLTWTLAILLGLETALQPINILYLLRSASRSAPGRRAARHRARRRRWRCCCRSPSVRPGRLADHARRHLLRRAVRRLDDGDPDQPARRVLLGGDGARRAPDGPTRARPDRPWRRRRSARSSPGTVGDRRRSPCSPRPSPERR